MTAYSSRIEELLAIMSRLRDPQTGCPWDLEQDFSTIAPYTIEEAYEVADAISRSDMADLRDELGDLLFQVVFHSQMAKESGSFGFDEVVQAISDKLIRRHPHVFGSVEANDSQTVLANWETIKRAERDAKGEDKSALAGIGAGLPEWQRAAKLQKRAARTGFDWTDVADVLAKLREEVSEVEQEIAQGGSQARLEDEIGDVLFVALRLASQVKVDAGAALRRANAKFERRFRAMETFAASDARAFSQLSLAEMQAYWCKAKAGE